MSRLPAVLLLALGWVAGCTSARPPTAVPLPADDPRPGALLEALDSRGAELEALRGMARLAVDGPEGSIRSRQVLVAARPARLRIEVQGFLSQTLALLVTDGESYQLFQVKERSFEEDRVRPGLLWEVAGIDLEPAEAVRVLLGDPDTAALELAGGVALDEGAVGVLLVDGGGLPRRALEFDADGVLRRLTAWNDAGLVDWDAHYDDVETLGSTAFAHAIEIDFPATGVQARLELSRIDLNPELMPGLFELPAPASTTPLRRPGGGG